MSHDWRGRRVAGLVALVALLLAGGCSGQEMPSLSPSPWRVAREPDPACAAVPLAMPCRAINVDGRTQRFAVVPGEGDDAAEIVVVDLGGPGRSLFGTDDLITLAAVWGSRRTLLFLEEPWSTTVLTPDCRTALSRTYVAWKANTAVASDLASRCPGQWGWDAASYADAAAAVVDVVRADVPDAKVVGTVGISQGAERTSWLWERMHPDWAVVVSPPPRTASATAFLERRTAAVRDSWIDECPGCVDAAGVDTFVATARARWAASPQTIEGRSVPVDGTDAVAAIVAASYGPGAARRSLGSVLDEPSPEAATQIGGLSDALLMRYGVEAMAAGQLAYYQELCPLYPGWNEVNGKANEIGTFFARVHEPCAQFATATGGATPTDLPSPPATTCLASASDDGVTGQESTEEWAQVLGSKTIRVDVKSGQHGALDLVAACASALGVDGP